MTPAPDFGAGFLTSFAGLECLSAASPRITETATRVRIAFASACPEAVLFRTIAHGVQIAGPCPTGPVPRNTSRHVNRLRGKTQRRAR